MASALCRWCLNKSKKYLRSCVHSIPRGWWRFLEMRSASDRWVYKPTSERTSRSRPRRCPRSQCARISHTLLRDQLSTKFYSPTVPNERSLRLFAEIGDVNKATIVWMPKPIGHDSPGQGQDHKPQNQGHRHMLPQNCQTTHNGRINIYEALKYSQPL